MLTHKHPFFDSSGRRLKLAMVCFTVFLKKGKYGNKYVGQCSSLELTKQLQAGPHSTGLLLHVIHPSCLQACNSRTIGIFSIDKELI